MKNYYIGMFNQFDEAKYNKDFTSHISGIELSEFHEMSEVQKVLELSKKYNFNIGIHFPLLKSSYKYRDPQVTSMEEDEVVEAFDAIIKELKLAQEIGAQYLLIHFPKPLIYDSVSDWRILRCQPYDSVSETLLERETFIDQCQKAMRQLNNLSEDYNMPIVLEMEFINKWFYEETWFTDYLKEYKNLSICLDFSRLHFQDYIVKDFDVYAFISALSSYTSALHVANLQVDGVLGKRHYPAFSHLSSKDGWADIRKHIWSLTDKSKLKNILFEHRTEDFSREQVVSCYEWVKGLIGD